MKTVSSIVVSFVAAGIMASCCGKTDTTNNQDIPKMPMSDPYENTLEYTWAQKKVLDSKLLSGMETMDKWEHKGEFGTLALSTDKVHDGEKSLLIVSPTKGPTPQIGRAHV